ncbi:hypothetical protein [Paeniglutamicibacter gangotriensis]|uniref:Uncharacterized protein n=1 Tax=Paeniglutamicibacter gangotriensis Lz1y TaxID=1276920 RepID=M7MTR4_9MICC|nr:hypothetical protein [Paeniglutamicibacter gangotriensis]EMQ98426.1 hypothetical protein ADIAG_02446 [Paeniglutamicibacter gangotriensis Lz1y]
MELYGWAFPTVSWRECIGEAGGSTGTVGAWLRAGDAGIGLIVRGTNLFGPIGGPWDADNESRF